MIRILTAIFGLILGWCGFMSTAEATIAAPTPSYVDAYEYNGHQDSPEPAFALTERGPPSTDRSQTTYDAVDRWSRGSWVRSEEAPSRAAYNYDHRAPHTRAAQAAVTAQERVGPLYGHRSPLGQVGVAAETGGGGVLRHYTTREFADSIVKDGTIEPGGSGKIWLTPDKYANGTTARALLALNKTPDGYFEIPMSRIGRLEGPGRVEPWGVEPGGGTEFTTPDPIDVGGLMFRMFGERP